MNSIGKLQKESSGMSKVLRALGSSMQQIVLSPWLDTQIQIGLVMEQTASPPQVMFSVFVKVPFVGRVRSRKLLLYLQQRQSTEVQ